MAKPKEPEANGSLEVSRRGFLTGASAVISSSLVAGTKSLRGAPKSSGTQIVGPGKVPIILKVNGVARKLELEPRMTLLDALRFELELTGAKRVCDRGTCGGLHGHYRREARLCLLHSGHPGTGEGHQDCRGTRPGRSFTPDSTGFCR